MSIGNVFVMVCDSGWCITLQLCWTFSIIWGEFST